MADTEFIIDSNFQTPIVVCSLMAKMAFKGYKPSFKPLALEPTPGDGNLVHALQSQFYVEFPSGDFWQSELFTTCNNYNVIVMNPPFNPMAECERFVNAAMSMCNKIIVLLPWYYIINSERRLSMLKEFGLVSITALPRKTFPRARVQTAIFELVKGHSDITEFKTFNW